MQIFELTALVVRWSGVPWIHLTSFHSASMGCKLPIMKWNVLFARVQDFVSVVFLHSATSSRVRDINVEESFFFCWCHLGRLCIWHMGFHWSVCWVCLLRLEGMAREDCVEPQNIKSVESVGLTSTVRRHYWWAKELPVLVSESQTLLRWRTCDVWTIVMMSVCPVLVVSFVALEGEQTGEFR